MGDPLKGYNLAAAFVDDPPYTLPSYSVTINTVGGDGQVFTAINPGAGSWYAAYPQATTTGPEMPFAYHVRPDVFHDFLALSWVWSGVTYITPWQTGHNLGQGSYTANLVPSARLKIDIIGEGIVTSNNFQASYHPMKLVGGSPYPGLPVSYPTPADSGSNFVAMSALPCKGWRFSHWMLDRGSGPVLQLEGSTLPVFMNWWEGTGYRLAYEETIMHVKAVFVEDPVKVTVLSGFQWSSSGEWRELEEILEDPDLNIEEFGMHHLVTKIPVGGCNGFYEPVIRNENGVSDIWPNIGGGPVLQEVLAAITQEGIRRFAFIGFSKGGGSVADLCYRLTHPHSGDDHAAPDFPSFSIVFTGYIDAIAQPLSGVPPAAETLRPEGSGYHSNLFTNVPMTWQGLPLHLYGAQSDAVTEPNDEINTLDCVAGVDHMGIAQCEVSHEVMLNRLRVAAHGVAPIPFSNWEWCTVHNLSCP